MDKYAVCVLRCASFVHSGDIEFMSFALLDVIYGGSAQTRPLSPGAAHL